MGTPAEEEDGGKVRMIRAGAFKDVDFAMMAHPSKYELAKPNYVAVAEYVHIVIFKCRRCFLNMITCIFSLLPFDFSAISKKNLINSRKNISSSHDFRSLMI